MSDKEAPKRIWLQARSGGGGRNRWITWCVDRINDDDIKYYRADSYHACLEAGCSLHYHLFELINAEKSSDVGCNEMEDVVKYAQLGMDAWNRFLDGKEE